MNLICLVVLFFHFVSFICGVQISKMKSIPLINKYQLNNSPIIGIEPLNFKNNNQKIQTKLQQKQEKQEEVEEEEKQLISRNSNDNSISSNNKLTFTKFFLTSWGVLGVVMFIANALKRLIPVALQPVIQKDLTREQGIIYIIFMLSMMYIEGYKAFHLKFSPLVVKRALHLSENPTILNCLLAGPYCMGLFGATKKRMIVSWSVMIGVFGLVKIVKLLPYPWRSIVDGGVICGLTIGTLSIIYHYLLALLGYPPSINPDLPNTIQSQLLDSSLSSSSIIENKLK